MAVAPVASASISEQVQHARRRNIFRSIFIKENHITTLQETILDSDHALLIADIKIKLADTKKKRRTTCPKQFRRPTDAQKQAFNQHVSFQI